MGNEERVVGAQTIHRALAVLSLLRRASGDVGVSEIGHELDLHTSTTHRILRALLADGFVSQNAESGRYRLGRESLLLGLGAERTLGFSVAEPLLEQLCEQTGESTNLVVRDGDRGLVVLRVDSVQPLRFSQPTGTRIPLYCTSSGKVLMAFGGDAKAEVDELGELPGFTKTTITSKRLLVRQLREVREQGFALNEGERNPGVSGVAVPVFDAAGSVLAALALQGPQVRLPSERLRDLGADLLGVAREVSAVLPAATNRSAAAGPA